MAKRSASLKRPKVYDALVGKGFSHMAAAKISNAQARKAAIKGKGKSRKAGRVKR